MFFRYAIDSSEGPDDMILCDECQKEVDWTDKVNQESGGCERQGNNCEEA